MKSGRYWGVGILLTLSLAGGIFLINRNRPVGQIRLAYRHFPLPGHRWSALAHQAAECAHRQGRFWEYHDRLYAEQTQWSLSLDPTETFLRYAGDLGLDLDAFAVCLGDAGVGREILLEKNEGERLKITATPTFFIRRERVVGPRELEMKGEALIRTMLGLPPKPKAAKAAP